MVNLISKPEVYEDDFAGGKKDYLTGAVLDELLKRLGVSEQIAAGLNPKEERERQEQAEVEAKALAESEIRWRTPFRTVADEWIEVKENEGLWAHDARGADKARSYLRNWILPVLGDMLIIFSDCGNTLSAIRCPAACP